MRGFIISLAFLLLLTTNTRAYTQKVLALYPIFTEDQALLLPGLEGRWLLNIVYPDTLSISRAGDNFYRISLHSEPQTAYEGVVTKIGASYFLELLPIWDSHSVGAFYKDHYLPVRSLYKIALSKGKLQVAELSYPWFYKQLKEQKTPGEYAWLKTSLVLTAPTAGLRAFLDKHQQEPAFFSGAVELHYIPDTGSRQAIRESRATPASYKPATHPYQPCLPDFPLKDGWLGGDGDVSVPLNDHKTLWLFSDTFVGEKTARRSSRMQMVSNSAAITTCEPNGKSSVEYYWKNPYTPDPRPVFESYTQRFAYWVSDALMIDNSLYVLLLKVQYGQREPSMPNETFNFEPLGWTLAKVDDPASTNPPDWKIDYTAWSDVLSVHAWTGQLARQGDSLYTFYRGTENQYHLLRFPARFIEAPREHMEYYATNGSWHRGTGGLDAAVQFRGDDAQTVEYHADLEQWIMIIGPGVLNRRIRIRTAKEITGPWSEERLIYEVPEATPGKSGYDKYNFSYLGREHLQFYNKKDKKLVITYDVNTGDFNKIMADDSLYKPKVISVSLKDKL